MDTPHGLQAVRSLNMRRLLPYLILCLGLAACGGPEPSTRKSAEPNRDIQRFALLLKSAGKLHIGASKERVMEAYPPPAGATRLLESELPPGYSVWGWTRTQKSPASSEALIAYFHAGKLIQASHSESSMERDAVNARVEGYKKQYGDLKEEQGIGKTVRTLGNPDDYVTLELQTLRLGNSFQFAETLTDMREVAAMTKALSKMRDGKK